MDCRGVRVGMDDQLVDDSLELGLPPGQNPEPREGMAGGGAREHAYPGVRVLGHDVLEQRAGVLPVLEDVVHVDPHHVLARGPREGVVLRRAEVEDPVGVVELRAHLLQHDPLVRVAGLPVGDELQGTVLRAGIHNHVLVGHGEQGVQAPEDAPLAVAHDEACAQ